MILNHLLIGGYLHSILVYEFHSQAYERKSWSTKSDNCLINNNYP